MQPALLLASNSISVYKEIKTDILSMTWLFSNLRL